MNIPPINPAAAYQATLEPVSQKNIEELNDPSPFRAWARGAETILAAASAPGITPALQSSEAFWAQWPGKSWKATS